MSDIFTVNDLNLWYGPTQALHHVTLSVPENSNAVFRYRKGHMVQRLSRAVPEI